MSRRAAAWYNNNQQYNEGDEKQKPKTISNDAFGDHAIRIEKRGEWKPHTNVD